MNPFMTCFTLWGFVLLALSVRPSTLGVGAEPSAANRAKPSAQASAVVRVRAAMARAEANDADAIPVLIDLLADLTADQRWPVEEFLTQLAGEWAPVIPTLNEDKISGRIRRDCWAVWWRNTDGAALLAAVREHTLTAETRKKVDDRIARLGDAAFTERENATKDLFALGRITLQQLREARKHQDREIARRAKLLTERIEREPAHHLPVAALRLLALRKPVGSVAALLAYLPHAEDELQIDEVRKSLTALALRDGKPDADLLHALTDSQPLPRFTAVEALAKGGGIKGRSAVRKLLKGAVPTVRLRVALALALAKERDSIPVLIDLLAVLPAEQIGEIESTLYQLAGDSAPETPAGTEPAEKMKCRDAWAAWWKVNANRVDLNRLTERSWYGYTLICDANQVYEIDRHGKRRWVIDNAGGPIDAWYLTGNRVLIAEWSNHRITERNLKGDVIWEKAGLNAPPTNVQRLPNGNTFITMGNGRILEVDRAGKEIYTINNMPGNILAAYRSPNGTIICLTRTGSCIQMGTNGKQLRSFGVAVGNNAGSLDLLPNGRILVATGNKVAEYDSVGKKLLEVDAPGATTPTGLPNGHLLVASQNMNRVFELDRTGKVVWEYKCNSAYRARRR